MEKAKNVGFAPPRMDTHLRKKYYSVIQKLDAMPDSAKNLLCRLILEWKE